MSVFAIIRHSIPISTFNFSENFSASFSEINSLCIFISVNFSEDEIISILYYISEKYFSTYLK